MSLFAVHCDGEGLGRGAEIAYGNFRWPPDITSGFRGEIQKMLIQFRAIHLKSRKTRLITRADFDAIVKGLLGSIGKPESKPLFRQLVVAEVTR